MKTKYIILSALILTPGIQAQMPQSITTYSSSSFPQTTTIWPQQSGGYNYSVIGNGRSRWGGVSAAPGTTVSAAVGSRGEIIPIVTPTAPAPTLGEMPVLPMPISYPVGGYIPRPRIQKSQPIKQYPKEIPPPAVYMNSPYGQYVWLHNQLTSDCMKQLAIDWRKDSGSTPGEKHETKTLLAYLRLWVRSHPGCLSGKVLKP